MCSMLFQLLLSHCLINIDCNSLRRFHNLLRGRSTVGTRCPHSRAGFTTGPQLNLTELLDSTLSNSMIFKMYQLIERTRPFSEMSLKAVRDSACSEGRMHVCRTCKGDSGKFPNPKCITKALGAIFPLVEDFHLMTTDISLSLKFTNLV